MSNIGRWLEEHGLGKYSELFIEHEIDFDVLGQITLDELRELGIPLGARKRILNAVDELNEAESVSSSHSPTSASPATGEAERRQLTVMFCDLVGSTELVERLDPEDYREVLANYQDAARRAIDAFDGYIARYMGDGLLVYFGYPAARENDSERAVLAGLAVVDAITGLGRSLEVRIGIATGPVVVGDIVGEGVSEEAAVLGETPNLAARLQALAAPNVVLLSPNTAQLLQGRIETQMLAEVAIKGFARPVVPYRALRPRPLSEVSDARREAAPLTGRDVEMALLERAWARVRASEGQAILLSGEPGMGKSRLLRAFQPRLTGEHARVQWHCSPYHALTTNYPAIEELRAAIHYDARDEEQNLTALEAMVRSVRLDPTELVPALAILLSISLGARYPTPTWSRDELRRQLTRAQVQLLLARAEQTPVLFLIEDLHWADPTTVEVLCEMISRARAAPVLFLMTSRPEFTPPWSRQPHAVTQRLTNLSREDATQMARNLTSDIGPSQHLIDQIVERADGVPLFIEELTKSVLETSGDFGVPASLQDSLMSRLDRLGETKELAQTASIVGRFFLFSDLTLLAAKPEETVARHMQELVDSGLVYQREGAAFEFKHALIRDAAYDSLLRNTRRQLHAQYADHLEATGADQPELEAQHRDAAAQPSQAAACWMRAGARALTASASTEASAHFEAALRSLSRLPAEPARWRLEVECHLKARDAHFATGQFDATAPHLDAAAVVAESLGDPHYSARVTTHLTALDWIHGDYDAGVARGRRALELAELDGDAELCALARYRLGILFMQLGTMAEARDQLEQALVYFDTEQGRECFEFGGYPFSFVASFLAWSCAELGDLERAVAVGRAGSEHARAHRHGYTFTCAVFGLAHALILADRLEEARVELEETLTYPGWNLYGPVSYNVSHLAYVYAALGNREQLQPMLERLYQGIRAPMNEGWSRVYLAMAELELGRLERAAAVLDAAEAVARTQREEAVLAWCFFLRAELALRTGDETEAALRQNEAQALVDRLSLGALSERLAVLSDRVARDTRLRTP